MKIKFLRLDLHLKRKQKKNHKGSTNVFIREERKKKKPREEGVHQRRKKKKKKTYKQSRSDLGRGATWIYRARPVSPAWIWRGLGRLELISISSSSSSLSFFFSFFLHFLPLFLHFGLHFGSLIFYFWVRNRVLETRFPCKRHLEKVPHQRRTTHENRVLEARFRSPKSSL